MKDVTPTKNSEIIRKSFGLKKEILPDLQASYDSPLIDQIKAQAFTYQKGRFTIRLAEEFGFCYGVDRAIDYAYETRAKFPDRRIFLTNEIIHNPRVNAKLEEMGILFLSKKDGFLDISEIKSEDVVLIPAFGNPTDELKRLQAKGCVLVDTTCGSVMSVWKRVESYTRDGFTAVIHGKYNHEETLATSSRANKYVIVRDKEQSQLICDYIQKGGDKNEFLETFAFAVSKNFNPDEDLQRVGCANQTTMLSSESLEIADMLKKSMDEKYGATEARERFRHFDTICSATQDRQDAVLKLIDEGLDLMIVVGGFNSSNTGHLVEMSLDYFPAYHVKDADCLISKKVIQHKKAFGDEIIETNDWLKDGNLKVGVTAGASTPNRVIEEVIQRLLEFS